VRLAVVAALAVSAAASAAPIHLEVPIVPQARERCGPAALAMVLRWYGADSAAVREAEEAYDPALKGALITDLAAAARRAGFEAAVEHPGEDSLVALLRQGVPPILLYQRGVGPVAVGHYGVVVGWEAERARFTLHDGGARPRRMSRAELLRRWNAADGRALVVRRR
jgi:ABC-type bacteriocin/lantibiotic exporter with double-glycine peptidase domain